MPSGTGRGDDTVAEAHNSTLAWEQPILPAKYIESSCGECHRGALPGTPQLNQGRNLLVAPRLCALSHGEVAGRNDIEGDGRSAVAVPYRRQDNARMDFCMAQRSAGLRCHLDHAELQVERRRCTRHLGISDREQHASAGMTGTSAGEDVL